MTGDGPARLSRLLAAGGTVLAPGAYDPLTARIVERAGYEAIYLGGNALGLHLGKAQPFVTLTETAEATARIARSVEAPVIVDAGAGFGDPAHVRLAVRELEAAGAAALHIDDQPYPKAASYHRGQGRVAPVEAASARLRVALAARRNPDLKIIARTDVLRTSGALDRVIERALAFRSLGVDALMVLDLTPETAEAVRQAAPGLPLAWIGGVGPPIPTTAELEGAGFALAVYPFNTLAAVTAAVTDLWVEARSTGEIPQSGDLLRRMRAETTALADLKAAWDIEDDLR